MDFRQHDDTIIELRLTDRRGRSVRAAQCEDLKIRVWTQDPREYISFYPRDIRQERHRDFLLIPDYEMGALPPGVIVYAYSFRELLHGPGGRHDEYEKRETVVTELMWHGMHRDPLPKNPVNAHTIEGLRRELEDMRGTFHRGLSNQRERLNNYMEETEDWKRKKDTQANQTELSLSQEVTRAKGEEERIENRLKNAETQAKKRIKNLEKELTSLKPLPDSFFEGLFSEKD